MASNLWEFYSGQGQALPSLSARSQIYQQYGLGSAGSYRGSVAQNNALLAALQGGGAPAPAPAPTAGGGGGNASPSPNYGAYGDIINTLSGQAGQLDQIYDPQVTTIQNYMPTIQKKYSDMLAELTRQTDIQTGKLAAGKVTDVGNMAVQQAGAGVAEAFGTPEMAAQQAVKTKYDQAQQDLLANTDAQRKAYGTQQSQEELAIQQQIAALLGQKTSAAQSIQNQIAQAKAQALEAAEKTRQFNEQLAESKRATNISAANSRASAATEAGKGWRVVVATDKSTARQSIEDLINGTTTKGRETGLNFFDPNGNPVSVGQYATAKGISIPEALANSPDPFDKTIIKDFADESKSDAWLQQRYPWLFQGM